MLKVKFNYNINKDAWSWVAIAKDKNLWGLNWKNEIAYIPKELLSKILKSSFSRAVKITENYIENNPKRTYKEILIKSEIDSLKKTWGTIEEKYFKILAVITQKPIFSENFGCFLTTGFMCPYNQKDNWFMISVWHSLPFSITTICHEIMHLQFLHDYKNYLEKKGLKNNQIEDLKESLTFLLNEPEFEEIILSEDIGYPEHIKLRKKLKSIWLKDKNFQNLIDRAILAIKKSYSQPRNEPAFIKKEKKKKAKEGKRSGEKK
ncbi:MAG: hypothetical protein A3J65_03460 [Candidatus Buchananbacteria bacterium RIFCSPHIGHO2_02_FULL_45_11b]|uniref:Uncharacterized protein n=4 Tax=Candidatus Buchananiibacteriota TaxID=1817903 RepID=A0A1G1Y7V5_9BACT|nr:MAG: hypothetical protein A2663_01620 [Candidatus Buchananbacteria bacterium RIFCSPHIGHO2_01_FULL_46_12]OGY51871.1 MAG: hypothetical protein A3J65_03460 [Candidatus Buchananbacteria bacterium RIFCSPHIGHO2_02_FULL_45_11b]OGY54161.1 MAG: hypothetical protein A3B15_00025 [Candidatus Buchananbacteria bacterium RIFCSPLOWO2_01_FULL_45_31]OGY56074.1 MAG: hypothetical protein A3H67_04145 [Candidatus Buchananbacteria bacterium RIFCSPLOWO2_02_FULL_46_11b]